MPTLNTVRAPRPVMKSASLLLAEQLAADIAEAMVYAADAERGLLHALQRNRKSQAALARGAARLRAAGVERPRLEVAA